MRSIRLIGVAWLMFFPVKMLLAQQNPENVPQSIIASIKASKPDTNRARLYVKLGRYYVDKVPYFKMDIDRAKHYFAIAIHLSDSIQSIKWKNEALMGMGLSFNRSFHQLEGRQFYATVADYYKKRGERLKEAWVWIRAGDEYLRDSVSVVQRVYCFVRGACIFHEIHQDSLELEARKRVADMHLVQGKYELSEKELLQIINGMKAIGIRKISYTYDLLASVSTVMGNLHNELYYELEAVKNIEETKDYAPANFFYNKLANTYHTIGMNDKSLYYYRKALPFARIDKNMDAYYDGLRIIAGMLSLEHKGNEALKFLSDSSRKYAPATINQKKLLAKGYAAVYENMKLNRQAEANYREVIRLARLRNPMNDKAEYAEDYYDITRFYINTRQYALAKPYLRLLVTLPPFFLKPVVLCGVKLFLFKIDSASGNLSAALKNYQAYTKLNDSLYGASQKRMIEIVQVKSESEKKDMELKLQAKNMSLLKKQSQLEHSQLRQSSIIVNLLIWGSCALLILLLFGYNRYRQNQISNRRLKETQQVLSEKNVELEHSLAENDWLLKEVHHRVKNNMHTVMSLLHTQCSFLNDESAIRAITESRHRIQAMALIHQKLYKTTNASSIYMPEYVAELVECLRDSFETGHSIYFNLDVSPIYFSIQQVIPVGLILNEAITNSIRYAFPIPGDAEITVKLSRIGEEEVMLLIKDNGRGFNTEIELSKQDSFGLMLIRGLIGDLGGTITLDGNAGTSICTVFKLNHNGVHVG
jgi:two-component sensor histidine kinase